MLKIVGFGGQIDIAVQHVQLKRLLDYGSMQWKVSVQAHGFNGQYDNISI